MSDKELNEILKNLKDKQPTDLQIQKWKAIAKKTKFDFQKRRSPASPSWLQLTAATMVGVIIGGALVMGLNEPIVTSEGTENYEEFATIEHVHTKLN